MVNDPASTDLLERQKVKHLRVEYNGIVLFDGNVDEVSWNDSDNGVTVTGKMRRAGAQGGGAGGFLEMLTNASRQRTQNVVAEKRAGIASAENAPDQGEREVMESSI